MSLLLIGCGIIVIGLTSCSEKQPTRDGIVKNFAETFIKEKMNDPSSYEFVKQELIDSITFSDNIEFKKDELIRGIEYDRRSLERQEEYRTYPTIYDESKVEKLKVNIERNERILLKIDSIANLLGDRKNEVTSYKYIFTFRGNNALGAKIVNEYFVQTESAPDFKIFTMTNEEGKLYPSIGNFPGYEEMIEIEKEDSEIKYSILF